MPEPVNKSLARALLSLEGLATGDAFGSQFFELPFLELKDAIAHRTTPPAAFWPFTDDTMMAISILELLRRHGEIREPALADHFAELYDPMRGYGPATNGLLLRIRSQGGHLWRQEAQALYNGRGSFGNGAAMRVAPLGAYFAHDLDRLVPEAIRSAQTTHTHPEAAAGAIAVAIAAALASHPRPHDPSGFLKEVLVHVPESEVKQGIHAALELPANITPERAGLQLGNGSHVSVQDTVPFVLWAAAHYLHSFEDALWHTLSALGDKDTTCAIVGGIVVLATGLEAVPPLWRRRCEPLINVWKP